MAATWTEWILLAFMVGVPVAWFFLVPQLIYQTQKFQAEPVIARVENESDLPEPVRQYFFAAYETLTPIGFAHQGTYYLPSPVENVRCIVNAYDHLQDQSTGLVVAAYASVGGTWSLQATFVGFETRFVDGSTIETSNQPTIGAFPKPLGSRLLVQPELQDPSVLYRAHGVAVSALQGGRKIVDALAIQHHGDASAMLQHDVRHELEGAAKLGYLKLVAESAVGQIPKAHQPPHSPYQPPGADAGMGSSSMVDVTASDSSGAHYHPTLWGAYAMTWKEIWPLKSILLATRSRKDRQFLEDNGFVT